jgi:hypothetical protein
MFGVYLLADSPLPFVFAMLLPTDLQVHRSVLWERLAVPTIRLVELAPLVSRARRLSRLRWFPAPLGPSVLAPPLHVPNVQLANGVSAFFQVI